MDWIFSLDEIDRTAEQFLRRAGNRRVIAFHGGLGAGKTTFIGALCRIKGVTEVISSPTFSHINDYVYSNGDSTQKHIFHLDLYRINSEEEAVQAGIEDCLYSGSLCMVEWPEKISGLLPGDTLHAFLEVVEEGRKLRLEQEK
jgi:tRNA threonylcarbamoyladenosine biosynthesis protein TsaE